MRIAYCDHSFHQKTESTLFLPSLLQEKGLDVDFFWDSSWNGGPSVEFQQLMPYDAIIIFQAIPKKLPECVARQHKNVTFIPMLDQFGIARGPLFDLRDFWKPFRGSKILSFSTAVHAIAVSNGLASECYKYMPPSIASKENALEVKAEDCLKVFYWARRPSDISIPVVCQLLSGIKNRLNIHVHLSVDPGEHEISEDEARSAFAWCESLKISRWFADKKDLINAVRDCDIYIAPRFEEGIGQSFLEALSAGLCIVAPDNGTMNEYLIDGVNGLLYNPRHPMPLVVTDIRTLKRNAWITSDSLRRQWISRQDQVIDFLIRPSAECYSSEHKYHSVSMGHDVDISDGIRSTLKWAYRRIRG